MREQCDDNRADRQNGHHSHRLSFVTPHNYPEPMVADDLLLLEQRAMVVPAAQPKSMWIGLLQTWRWQRTHGVMLASREFAAWITSVTAS